MLTYVFLHTGADFTYRENFNDLLEVEWMGGDSEMTEEEYAEERYCRDQLRPTFGLGSVEQGTCAEKVGTTSAGVGGRMVMSCGTAHACLGCSNVDGSCRS
jgi:hypothetical protein